MKYFNIKLPAKLGPFTPKNFRRTAAKRLEASGIKWRHHEDTPLEFACPDLCSFFVEIDENKKADFIF